MKVAMPRFFLRSSSTHACAAAVVPTTMKSSPGHAVDMATSYFPAARQIYQCKYPQSRVYPLTV